MKILGRTGIEYTEGSKSMFVDSEFMAVTNPVVIVLIKKSIQKWDSPNEDEIVSEADRERILDNIARALQFRDLEVDIV